MGTDALFKLTDAEFGDVYHIAAASVLCSGESRIEVEVAPGTSKADAMYHFLRSTCGTGQVTREPSERKADPLWHATALISRWASRNELPAERDRGIHEIHNRFLQCLSSNDQAAVEEYLKQHEGIRPSTPKVLVWLRNRRGHAEWRNTTAASAHAMSDVVTKNGHMPVLIGHRLPDLGEAQLGAGNLVEFFSAATFSDHPETSIARQLWMFHRLMSGDFNVRAQIGLISGGMDGPALLKLPTVEFAPTCNDRMSKFETLLSQSFKVVKLGCCNPRTPFVDFSPNEFNEMVQFLTTTMVFR